jgi:hypothetical protein
MITDTQNQALSLMKAICAHGDGIRLGQLMTHLGFLSEDETGHSLAEIDDNQLVSILDRHLCELSSRSAQSLELSVQLERPEQAAIGRRV